ncbi:MAG: CTP synthase, partial [Pseudohongiellaceae bacterium]
LRDAATIYSAPLLLHATGLDEFVVERFNLECPPADLSEWQEVVKLVESTKKEVVIAMVGKYMDLLDAYKSLIEAIKHAGIHTSTEIKTRYIDAETIEKEGTDVLNSVDAIVVPGGFGERGIEGMIKTVQYARENKIPYLGICLGLHIAVIEFARNVLGLKDAHSTEFNKDCADPVIGLITEWTTSTGDTEIRDENSDLGGTMRLGGQECRLQEGSLARSCYQQDVIIERHRHRYEVNNNYVEALDAKGLKVSGKSMDNNLMEIMELPEHPWFLGCQFHPEFTSSPRDGHPLFTGFIKAAVEKSKQT